MNVDDAFKLCKLGCLIIYKTKYINQHYFEYNVIGTPALPGGVLFKTCIIVAQIHRRL